MKNKTQTNTITLYQCPLCKKTLNQLEAEVMKLYNFTLCVTCRTKQESKGGDKK